MHKRTASEKLSLNPEISRPPSGTKYNNSYFT